MESRFLYYNGELLAELDQDQEISGRYVLGYGVAAGWNRRNEGYHFYHLDEQNSTTYITGQAGDIVNRYQYDAFGRIRNNVEGFNNRILYTGQQYDQISGQHYLRARYYNSANGRFLQEDVYRGDGLNLYAYCKNNPVIYYDPSGYAPKPVSLINSSGLYPVSGNQLNVVTITMTGSRSSNFTAAFAIAGIKKSDATGYTWHHEPDFDPITGTTTMVLVETSVHEANLPHSGSVSQYEKAFDVEYDTYEAKMVSYENGWREKEPQQRQKEDDCKG